MADRMNFIKGSLMQKKIDLAKKKKNQRIETEVFLGKQCYKSSRLHATNNNEKEENIATKIRPMRPDIFNRNCTKRGRSQLQQK